MAEFSLRTLTAEVLAETTSEDREQIVKEIEHRVPAAMVAAAFRQALPAFVHQAMPYRFLMSSDTGGNGGGGGGHSAKVDRIREAWRKELEGRYTVEDGSLRRIGDCGEADLLFVADKLERYARTQLARAGAMKSLAAALAEHETGRVRDLPAVVLASVFGSPS